MNTNTETTSDVEEPVDDTIDDPVFETALAYIEQRAREFAAMLRANEATAPEKAESDVPEERPPPDVGTLEYDIRNGIPHFEIE